MKKVFFKSDGYLLAGNIFYPPLFDQNKKYPTVIVSGSWTTVKEQMAGLYARKLSETGFITFAFDFRNFGESQGNIRFFESPTLKAADINNAAAFLQSLPEVDSSRIGALGVCAGAMYTLMAASVNHSLKAVVSVASWLHDSEAVKLFYGGESGVNGKIEAARQAKEKYAQTGVVDYIPTISTTDPSAAMFGPYDYYLNPQRGAIPQWSADKFAVMSWEDWLTARPMETAEKLQASTLMIHSSGCVLPDYTKKYYDSIPQTNKQLLWLNTDLPSPFHQFNFYDQEQEVSQSTTEAGKWFTNHM